MAKVHLRFSINGFMNFPIFPITIIIADRFLFFYPSDVQMKTARDTRLRANRNAREDKKDKTTGRVIIRQIFLYGTLKL